MKCLLRGLMFLVTINAAQAQDWLLVDANEIRPDTHLVLTVPIDDPANLARLGEAIEADYGVPLTAEWPLQSIDVHCFVFDASTRADVDALILEMEADGRIRTVQRIRGYQSSEARYVDPLFPLQWSLDDMNIPHVHLHTEGGGIRVGVIDTAIDRSHQDLSARVIDARDFVSRGGNPVAEAHGTAIAGVIAAEARNAVGMVGVAPRAELIGLRACWQGPGEDGRCNSFSLARALNFAILNDIRLLNISVGGPEDPLVRELIEAALEKGTIIIAASGEEADLTFPASQEGVIAAGMGPSPRVPAPMLDVITTAPGDAHRYASGSSVATAHVSGVVALMLSVNATLTGPEIYTALQQAVAVADDRSTVLDACKALELAKGTAMACAE